MTSLAKMLIAAMLFQAASPSVIEIRLQHASEAEQKTRARLEKLLQSYDLHRWTFTRKVVIDERAVPHSHPVLTLDAWDKSTDDQLLSGYVHEQLHWWLAAQDAETQRAEAELRKLYPHVPVGYPEGAVDEQSTYLHLIDCYLEMRADRQLIGKARTEEVMHFLASHHYRWVYRTVLADEQQIAKIVKNNGLEVE